jgi:hypothetical protein
MKTYKEHGGKAPDVSDTLYGDAWSASWSNHFTSRKNTAVPTGEKAGWVSKPVWREQ